MTEAATRRRFTVEEYYRMGEAGILRDGERVELIEGEIVTMAPIGPQHAGSVDALLHLWMSRVADRAIVRVQNPVRFSPASELQPDLALVRPRPDFYRKSHPEPADVLLLIEVADTTVETDRHVKIPLYAKAGIPEAWLLVLPADHVEVYRQPGPEGYQHARSHSRGGIADVGSLPRHRPHHRRPPRLSRNSAHQPPRRQGRQGNQNSFPEPSIRKRLSWGL